MTVGLSDTLTVYDWAHGQQSRALIATCQTCAAELRISADRYLRVPDPPYDIADLKRRLICACGGRDFSFRTESCVTSHV